MPKTFFNEYFMIGVYAFRFKNLAKMQDIERQVDG